MYLAESSNEAVPTGPIPTILEGIVRRRCLSATYNRSSMIVSPHALYTKHGDLFMDAVTVSRNLVMAREPKLGTFKLAGLTDLKLTGREFEPSDLFEPEAERYEGVALMLVETA